MSKERVISLNYSAAQLVNFYSIRVMILGADTGDSIIVRIEWKIKRKTRMFNDSVVTGAKAVAIVSEPEAKVYILSFSKYRRLE